MERQLSDLEDRFEDHQVEWFTVACSLGVERAEHGQREVQGRQLASRGSFFACSHGGTALAGVANLLCNSRILAQSWSGAQGAQSLHLDLVAMAASVDVHIRLHAILGEEAPHTLPGRLVDAFQEFARCVPAAAQALREGQVVHQEAFLQQQVGFELATLVPSEWMEVCRLRCPLRAAARVTHCTHRLNWPPNQSPGNSSRHLCSVQSCFRGSNVSIAAWFVSALGHCRLGVGQGV